MERVRSLLEQEHVDPDERGYAGWTPLSVAIQHEETEIAKFLIEAGADVDRRDRAWWYQVDGSVPLGRAALRGNTELVRLLLEHGAKVDKRDYGPKVTALMSAARASSPEVVEVLLAHGADVNARSREGLSPLHYAAGGRQLMNVWTRENARILIAHGADVEAKTRYNSRPLHEAAIHGDVPVLLLLIEHGARADVRDETGQTPLSNAAMNGQMQALHVLEPFFHDDRPAVEQAIGSANEYGQKEAARLLTKLAASR